METTEIAIIGGSAAGLSAAAAVAKRWPEKRTTVIRKVDKTVVPCGIPYIYGTLGAVDKNLIPDAFLSKIGVNLIHDEIGSIDRAEKVLVRSDGRQLQYDKLILSTGSRPFVPPIDGVELENVFSIHKDPAYLQTLYDALELARNVVVIGGGFIGVEMAEQIASMSAENGKKEIRLVEMLPHCLMMACEEEFCLVAEQELTCRGVQVMTNCQVKELRGADRVEEVVLADGSVLPADVVIIGIGAAPNTDLAASAGLEVDARRGVLVDEYLRSSDNDIYAVGDCASKFSFLTGKPSGIRLASVAASEGVIAAGNLYGVPMRKTPGAVGAFATKVGKRSIAAAGLTSHAAAQEGIDVVVGAAVAPNMHPGSLPGAIADMKVKLLFRRDNGQLVGGHVCGGDSSAELANALAVAIQARQTVYDLSVMQFATHPLLTASPVQYQLMVAAENALIGA